MSLKVGVSGVRGIFGDSLTEDIVERFAYAFGEFCKDPGGPKNKRPPGSFSVLVGSDTRESGPKVKKAVAKGLQRSGAKITDLGICSTPTVLLATRKLKARGAIIITASHNPRPWNGLKFVRSDGTFLTKSEAEKLIAMYRNTLQTYEVCNCRPRRSVMSRNDGAIDLHINEVLKYLDVEAIRKAKLKVALDYCNGTGAVSTPKLLKKLGVEVCAINTKPDGKFAHNPEPVPKNLKQLCALVKRCKADVGFAQDPDADRLAVVSERGVPIGEENTLALVVRYVLACHCEALHTYEVCNYTPRRCVRVVVNLSTSRMVDDIAKEFGAKVYRTAVGETNVVDKMRKVGAAIGGEGNGGVIFPAVNFGRDSFVAMGLILQYMALSRQKVSSLVKLTKQYKMVKQKKELPQKEISKVLSRLKTKFKNEKINCVDGVRVDLPEGWIHVRGSNTEPIMRIITEAETAEKAKELARRV